jgi:hypothetical protein
MESAPNTTRIQKDASTFMMGVNSFTPPYMLQEGQYGWAVNALNRGNQIQTRPGFKLVDLYGVLTSITGTAQPTPLNRITGINAQGITLFEATDLTKYLVIAVDGQIYVSKYPFTTFQVLYNIQFDPKAPQVIFKACKRGATTNPNTQAVSLIPQYNILIMQDGRTKAAYWDGNSNGHIEPSPPSYGTPIGLWMEWSGSRLWVASGSKLYASNIIDPLTFIEGTYLAEKDGFWFEFPITGLTEAPTDDALIVFTDRTTSAVKSHIRDRTLWQSTPNFQQVLLPSVGCVAGKSIANYYGMLWWWSRTGLINLDTALNSYRTGKIVLRDNEMMRSKAYLSPVTSSVCCGAMENLFLVSVPSGALAYNRETWVLDASPAAMLNSEDPPCWSGVWNGIQPVEWTTGVVNGENRIFCLSKDALEYNSGTVHVWEALSSSKQDNGNPIPCSLETRSVFFDGDFRRFKFAEIDIAELSGTVTLQVYYAGIRGPWIKVLDTTLQAETGSFGSINQPTLTVNTSTWSTYSPQKRTIRTNEVPAGNLSITNSVSGIEKNQTPDIDKAFQIRIDWQGKMAVQAVRIETDAYQRPATGLPTVSESGEHNIVTADGGGIAYP